MRIGSPAVLGRVAALLAATLSFASETVAAASVNYTLSRNTVAGFKSTTLPSSDAETEALSGAAVCAKDADGSVACWSNRGCPQGNEFIALVSSTPASANYVLGGSGTVSCEIDQRDPAQPQFVVRTTHVVNVVRGTMECPAAGKYAMTRRTTTADGTTSCQPLGAGNCQIGQDYSFSPDGVHVFGHFAFTGLSCATATAAPGQPAQTQDINPDPAVVEEGVCLSGSPTTCASTEEKGCGYVNGERICTKSPDLTAGSPCKTSPSGAVFCLSTASTGVLPNNGTTNQPATPTTQSTLPNAATGSGNVIVNYYDTHTTAESTNYGDGPGGNTGGIGFGGAGGGSGSGDPDGDGELNIDEDGMPSAPGFDEWDGGTGGVSGAAGDSPAAGWDPSSLVPEIPEGACESITLTYFGRSVEFPGTKGCVWIEQLKSILAFCLYVMTTILIGRTVVGSL